MLHGKGAGNYSGKDQSWLTRSYESNRIKGLNDESKLTDSEKLIYEISGAQGGGRTNSDTYEIKQFPFPTNPSIRRKQKVDIRKVDPRIGEMSD